jgi:hypothetical protein
VYSAFGSCVATGCNSGYALSANSCIANFNSTSQTIITHYGITWEIEESRLTGVFANGEPWVIGPVTIKKILPIGVDIDPTGQSGGTNGSMVNPIPNTQQGFEAWADLGSSQINYSVEKDISLSLPRKLVAGDALVSSITSHREVNRTKADTIAVLTVLSEAPPEGSFRPGFYGTDRTVRFNRSQIDWSVLKNLAHVLGTPTQAYIEAMLPALPWFEWGPGYGTGLMSPTRNSGSYLGGDLGGGYSTYGREVAIKWSMVALWLNMENTQAVKEKAMIQTIQSGIDLHSYLSNVAGGVGFWADGGHKVGRKFPLFLAAVALNDPILRLYASNPILFPEDQCTFIVQESDFGRILDPGHGVYTLEMIGLGEWGVKHYFNQKHDDSRWWDGVPYRFGNWPAMSGAVLATELMGQQAAWGHPAIFAYNERFHSISGFGEFVESVWSAYNASRVSAVKLSPNGGEFKTKQIVSMTTPTAGAQIRYTLDGSTPNDSSLIYTGPITVGEAQTITAIGIKSGLVNSPLSQSAYLFSYRPTSDWKLSFVDSEDPEGFKAIYSFDGNLGTFWNTEWKTPVPGPHEIQIDLGSTHYNISGFRYFPRQDGYGDGKIKKYEFYISYDGVNWGSPVKVGEFANSSTVGIASFPAKSGRFIKLKALSNVNNGLTTNIAEIVLSYSVLTSIEADVVSPVVFSSNGGNFETMQSLSMSNDTTGAKIYYTRDGSIPTAASTPYVGSISIPSAQIIKAVAIKPGMHDSSINTAPFTYTLKPSSAWMLHFVDSEDAIGSPARYSFDGNPSTFWHTEYRDNQPRPPHEIQINLGSQQDVSGFRYLPRQDGNKNGNVGEFEFYVSTDGKNWGTPTVSGEFVNTNVAKEVNFTAKTGQYIKFIALTDANGGPYTNMAEIELNIEPK